MGIELRPHLRERCKGPWLTSYVRLWRPQRWVRVGLFCTGCGAFTPDP